MFTPPEYLSPSSIKTFRDCPQKFKISRIDKVPEPPTWATRLGNFVHESLEHLYQADPQERTVENLRTIAADLWASGEWERQILALEEQKGTTKDFKVEAFNYMKNLWVLEDPAHTELDGMEHEVLADIDGVAMKGYIDRFVFAPDGSVIISDYKTGNIPNPRFNSEDDKFFQLLTYALMLESSDQETTSKVQLMYLKQPVIHEVATTSVNLSITKKTITETKKAIDSACATEDFYCNVTKLCDWCHYKKTKICPAWADK